MSAPPPVPAASRPSEALRDDARLLARAAAAVRDWLLVEGRFIDDPDTATIGLAERLIDAGVPLDRMSSAMPTLYATRRGLGRIWDRGVGVRDLDLGWDNAALYEASPYFVAHETRDWVNFRLDEVADDRFGIVPDLRASGITHYICAPVFFHDGARGGMTFATRAPDGFSHADLALLKAVEPAVAMTLDLKRAERIISETLKMYVGSKPHAQILAGNVRRGKVNTMAAVIVFADMSGFTALSSRMTAEETVALLNRYFDCVVPEIEAADGEVLKFIGDGVLAVFAAATRDDERLAGERALAATGRILDRVAEDRREAPPEGRFDIKLALHFGEVGYGNIGSGARLDFTAVGRGVNIASRIADLCGTLGRRLIVSEAFADLVGVAGFEALGTLRLRGIPEPLQMFAPTRST